MSAAAKRGVSATHFEAGSKVAISSLTEKSFVCVKMCPNRNGDGGYTKRNCVVLVTDTCVVELTPMPASIETATVVNVHELAALERAAEDATPELVISKIDVGAPVLPFVVAFLCLNNNWSPGCRHRVGGERRGGGGRRRHGIVGDGADRGFN